MSFTRKVLFLITAGLLMAGCAGQKTQSSYPQEAESQPDTAYEIEPWDGDGMEIPLDGSSRDAWNRSMARVKAHSKESTFITLENAVAYLLVYDLESRGNFDTLISRLDGQTGYEIIARTNWRKPSPGKGAPAEKSINQ
jgi:hypothetical protein